MSNTANSEKAPRVSVLMSVYNGERFLKNSVESILGQRFADFEFIILAENYQSFQIIAADEGQTAPLAERTGTSCDKNTFSIQIHVPYHFRKV